MIHMSPQQKKALGITTAVALVFGVYFLHNYFLLISLAAIIAFLFNPIYQRLNRRWDNPGRASAVTLICSLVTIIVPVTVIVILTINQISHIASTVTNFATSTDLHGFLQRVVDFCNQILANIGVSYRLTIDSIFNALSEAIKTFGVGFISSVIIYLYVFVSILKNQDSLAQTFNQLNPLGRDVSRLYIDRAAAMTKAMVRGQFLIAAMQGFVDALLLYMVGMHSAFFFFFLLLTALSIIPLGGGIVVIPIGIILVLTGHIGPGLFVLAGHLFIVTNIDNIFRPRLVPPEARLDPALILLSVFSGLAFFGFLGIVLGPVIMILIVTTIQVYNSVYNDINIASPTSKQKKWYKKIPFLSRSPRSKTKPEHRVG
jgi:predicted PurR-regulated permease PerM